jgi:LysM repeat protein
MDTASSKTPFVQVTFKNLTENITFQLTKSNADEETFKLYGISIENKTSGVLYHNLGVGGACFSALNYQKFFDKEFPYLNADFVICDWGGNDFMYKNRVEPELEEIMVQTLKKIRRINPDAVILIPSAQDINKKGKNVTAAKQYAALARKVALENNCLFYDWFVISGGPRSMFLWSELGIAGKDNVHLNAKGYRLKGELFTEALIKTLNRIENNQQEQSLVFDNQTYYLADSSSNADTVNFDKPKDKTTSFKKNKKEKKKISNISSKVNSHKVKKGETLSSIARKHKTSVAKIKAANGINGNKIRTGQNLIIK